jgi:polyhydroxybutyrate depolymerase
MQYQGKLKMKSKDEESGMKIHPHVSPRLIRVIAASILGLLLVAPLPAQDAQNKDAQNNDVQNPDAQNKNAQAQDAQEKIDVADVSRNYTVHLPKGYDQQQHYPVVILLHGRNQNADNMARLTHFNQLADKDGIIAVYPNATRGQWNIGVRPEQPLLSPRRGSGRRGGWGGGGGGYPGGGQSGGPDSEESRNRPEPADDVAFLNQMLDALALKYSVDAHRIYATGLGDGGFMALRAGCNMADRVAAIAPVGAAMPKTMICLPSRAVPALFIHGTDDPIVPDSGGNYKPGQFHVLSAEESVKTWSRFDHCAEKPAQDKLPPLQKGGKETKTFTYSGCQENAQVVLYSVKGGGNTWPGGEQYMSEKEIGKTSDAFNANDAIWNFLTTKRLPGESAPTK